MAGNYVIVGSTIEMYVRCVNLLAQARILWSSACDKSGDWACSTDDDTDIETVRIIADAIDPTGEFVVIYDIGGELTFCLEMLTVELPETIYDVMHAAPRLLTDANLVSRERKVVDANRL